jgi:hypothetical protein
VVVFRVAGAVQSRVVLTVLVMAGSALLFRVSEIPGTMVSGLALLSAGAEVLSAMRIRVRLITFLIAVRWGLLMIIS